MHYFVCIVYQKIVRSVFGVLIDAIYIYEYGRWIVCWPHVINIKYHWRISHAVRQFTARNHQWCFRNSCMDLVSFWKNSHASFDIEYWIIHCCWHSMCNRCSLCQWMEFAHSSRNNISLSLNQASQNPSFFRGFSRDSINRKPRFTCVDSSVQRRREKKFVEHIFICIFGNHKFPQVFKTLNASSKLITDGLLTPQQWIYCNQTSLSGWPKIQLQWCKFELKRAIFLELPKTYQNIKIIHFAFHLQLKFQ